jgi:hypothetical protein
MSRSVSPGARLACGAALIAGVLFGQDAVGLATSGGRLDPALRAAAGPVNVVVVMGFTPERFHTERLSTYGVFAGRDKAVNRVRLRMVSPENVRRLGGLAWVARVEPGR